MFVCFLLQHLKKEVPLNARAEDYLTPTMTALFHSPATRGPVMHFCESEARASRSNLGQWLLCLHHLTCTLQCSLAPGVLWYSVDYTMFCVTGPDPANQRRLLIESVSAERNAPRPIRGLFQESVYTRTHDQATLSM